MMLVYKKLSEVKKDEPVNIIVILKYFTKAPARTSRGTFIHAKIAVCDESILPKDFKISIFSRVDGSIPQFPRNTILHFQGVKIEEYKKMLDGRIFDTNQVNIIDPFNTISLLEVNPAAKQRIAALIAAFPNLFDKSALAPKINEYFSKKLHVMENTPFKLSEVTENTVQCLIGIIDELWDYKFNPATKMWDDFSIQITDNSIYPSTIRVFIKCCNETMPMLSRYSVVYLRFVKVEKVNWRIIGHTDGENVWDLNMKCGGPVSDLDMVKLNTISDADAVKTRVHELMIWSQLIYEKNEEIQRLSDIFGIKWNSLKLKAIEEPIRPLLTPCKQ